MNDDGDDAHGPQSRHHHLATIHRHRNPRPSIIRADTHTTHTTVIIMHRYTTASVDSAAKDPRNAMRAGVPCPLDGAKCLRDSDFYSYQQRNGWADMDRLYALEALFYHFRVDVSFFGHQHMYERTWPLVNNTARMLGRDGRTPVCEDVRELTAVDQNDADGTVAQPATHHLIRNADAPVHLTVGAGGQKEGHQGFEPEPPPAWLATKVGNAWGFGTLTVWANGTGLIWRQYLNGPPGAANDVLVDEMILVKDGPGRYDNERQDDPEFSVDRRCGEGYYSENSADCDQKNRK